MSPSTLLVKLTCWSLTATSKNLVNWRVILGEPCYEFVFVERHSVSHVSGICPSSKQDLHRSTEVELQRDVPAPAISSMQQHVHHVVQREETDTRSTVPLTVPEIVEIQSDGGNENVPVSVPLRVVLKANTYRGGAFEVR